MLAVFYNQLKYDLQLLKNKLDEGFNYLGGIEKYFKKEDRILLKPNLLAAELPEKAVTTHPVLMQAVAEYFLDSGLKIFIGDSPGLGSSISVAKKSGIFEIAEKLSIPFIELKESKKVSFANGKFIKQFEVAKDLDNITKIVSLPKFKNHGMTGFTGGMKNLFGVIPGRIKALWHTRMPDAELFSNMIVDLVDYLSPDFCIMDGIIAQEGNGPRSGTPIELGVMIMGSHPYLVDLISVHYVEYKPQDIHIVREYAKTHDLSLKLKDYTIYGNKIQPINHFNRARMKEDFSFFPKTWNKYIKKILAPKPQIIRDRCKKCGVCYEVCPVEEKAIFWQKGLLPEIDDEKCIRCFCCQELCPHEAIKLHYPLIAKLLQKY